ncbi:hypothetical protein ACH5RR_016359 [Cinchona calisaya]|uniref:Uncharacterized protein n=1 Tax=Cinchona calisaya TaxID=153742 RepID=A0ABD2ZYV2_9GENT
MPIQLKNPRFSGRLLSSLTDDSSKPAVCISTFDCAAPKGLRRVYELDGQIALTLIWDGHAVSMENKSTCDTSIGSLNFDIRVPYKLLPLCYVYVVCRSASNSADLQLIFGFVCLVISLYLRTQHSSTGYYPEKLLVLVDVACEFDLELHGR